MLRASFYLRELNQWWFRDLWKSILL